MIETRGYDIVVPDMILLAKESWKPQFVSQARKDHNCGQCVVAMITHLPVSIIEEFLKTRRGTDAKQVTGALRWFGYDCEVLMTRFNKHRDSLPDLCIVHTGHHWSLHFKGMIYDSCIGIFPISEEHRRIKSYIKVECPK